MKYLQLATRVFEVYIITMLAFCAILLSVLVFNTREHNKMVKDIFSELQRLEIVE